MKLNGSAHSSTGNVFHHLHTTYPLQPFGVKSFDPFADRLGEQVQNER